MSWLSKWLRRSRSRLIEEAGEEMRVRVHRLLRDRNVPEPAAKAAGMEVKEYFIRKVNELL